MKRIATILCIVLLGSAASQAELTLNSGDSFSYEFSSLPFNRQIIGQPAANYGYFYVNFAGSTFGAGDSVRMEFFENSFSEAPLRSMDFTPASGTPYGIYVGQAWQDLQGAFRLTQLTGSDAIDNINVQITRMNSDPTFNFYQQILTPVPEPRIAGLLVAGFLLLLRTRVFQRRASHA